MATRGVPLLLFGREIGNVFVDDQGGLAVSRDCKDPQVKLLTEEVLQGNALELTLVRYNPEGVENGH